MKFKFLAVVFIFLFVGCAIVRKRSSPLGDDRYFITCDGNGYANTGDTMQCLAEQANSICTPIGKKFRFLANDTTTENRMHYIPSFTGGNGTNTVVTRPHSSATIECFGDSDLPRESASVSNKPATCQEKCFSKSDAHEFKNGESLENCLRDACK